MRLEYVAAEPLAAGAMAGIEIVDRGAVSRALRDAVCRAASRLRQPYVALRDGAARLGDADVKPSVAGLQRSRRPGVG